jgi:predicted TIM-barrel fold metal-dependent hydrolase
MLLAQVAPALPPLTLLRAPPAVPGHEEHLAVARHKGNVYIDLSGWSPKYFRPILVKYISSILQDKALFGSDYPVLQPDRWLRDFETLELKPEVRQKILLDNAKKVLKL